MIIGTLKEVKDNENRVGLTPAVVEKLVSNGHTVYFERQAGVGSGFSDDMYESADAKLRDSAYDIVQRSDIIVKIKEPIPCEYYWLDLFKGKTLFTYLHLTGAPRELTDKLLENKITGIAYETVSKNGGLPLLAPMSQTAGILAIQYGAHYLQKKGGGIGVSLGHVDGADPAEVVVVGAGFVGKTAAMTGGGMGCHVTLLDINPGIVKLREREIKKHLGPILSKNVTVARSTPEVLERNLRNADLLIGAVLIPGAKAPQVVNEAMVKLMKKGAVIVDVAIDQGGCIWGSRPTSHQHPIYELEGKIYCCIPNMPGQVARQSTQALSNATAPYLLEMAEMGVAQALIKDSALRKGLNTYNGWITYERVARDLGREKEYAEPLVALGALNDRMHREVRKKRGVGIKKKSAVK